MIKLDKYYREKPLRDVKVDQTVYENIFSLNSENFNSCAISFKGVELTYEQLYRQTNMVASSLIESGIKINDVISVAMFNLPQMPSIFLGINKIGAISKWIDLRASAKDLKHYLNEHNCKILITVDILVDQINKIIDETKLEKVIVIPLNKVSDLSMGENPISSLRDFRYINFDEFIKDGDPDYNIVSEYYKDKPSLIIQSSGTTGMAKSIVHTDFSINNSIRNFSYMDVPLQKGKGVLVTVPPWIAYGLINSTMNGLAHGMRVELCPEVDKTTVVNNLGKFDVSFAAPLHYRYVMELVAKGIINKSAVKKCVLISGGDKITKEELELLDSFGVNIINGYGNNEGLGAEVINPLKNNKFGSIGIPFYGNEVYAFDEDGNKLKPKEVGEICVRTNTMFKEYVGLEEETKNVKKKHDDGNYWIHTKDLGYIDEEGYVYINGRMTRVIIRSAFKISADTIEKVINSYPATSQCVVVGVNDKEEVSVPMAFITLKEEYKEEKDYYLDEIRKHCEANLKSYELPKYFEYIEEIPYTKNNKQDYRSLENIGNDIVNNISKNNSVLKLEI